MAVQRIISQIGAEIKKVQGQPAGLALRERKETRDVSANGSGSESDVVHIEVQTPLFAIRFRFLND
jgi:hypothetical protein